MVKELQYIKYKKKYQLPRLLLNREISGRLSQRKKLVTLELQDQVIRPVWDPQGECTLMPMCEDFDPDLTLTLEERLKPSKCKEDTLHALKTRLITKHATNSEILKHIITPQ